MSPKRNPDPIIMIVTVLLVALGLIMVFSSSALMAWEKYDDAGRFLKKQLMWVALGWLAAFLAIKSDYRKLERLSFPLMAVSACLLMAVLLTPMGLKAGGALRWLRLGPVHFEPSEFAKIALMIYFAHSLARKGEKISDFTNGFLPHLIVLGVFFILLISQPDLGTTIVILIASFILFLAAGTPLRFLSLSALASAPFIYVTVMGAEYRVRRILAFLDPWNDPTDSGFQLVQSMLALGRGGLFGLGLGGSKQKLFFLPAAHTDFIFSIIGEELGFIGTSGILILFAILIWRGLRIAERCGDPFGAHLAFALTLMMGLQAVVNVGVITGMLPTKGLPLPFLSLGGSSLVANMASVGILLNVSRSVDAKTEGP